MMEKAVRDRERLQNKIDQLRAMSKEQIEAGRAEAVHTLATPPDGILCEKCGNTGYVMMTDENGYEMAAPCPACYQRRRMAHILARSGISVKDYDKYSLDSFEADRSEISAKMKTLAQAFLADHTPGGPGLGMFGASGMGKTHICIAVCRELTIRFGEEHHYFSYRSEIPELIKSMKSFSDDYDRAMYRWKLIDNLYIDDLFKLSGKVENGHLVSIEQADLKVMFDIINARYLNHKTTLFSSEYSVSDIARIDGALGSRIYDMVKPYGMSVQGENQRLKGA